MITFLLIISIIVLFIISLVWLLGKGFRQKFGRFDMPESQLNALIVKLLPDENILNTHLSILRERLIELGHTDLTEEQIIEELKISLNNEY